MEYIITPIWAFLELLCCVIFANSFLQKKNTKAFRVIAFALIWTIISAYTCMGLQGFTKQILTPCFVFILLSLLYAGPWYRRVLCVILYLVCLGVIDTLFTYGISAVLNISYIELAWKKLLYITVVTASKLLEILLAWLLLRIRMKDGVHAIRGRWLLLTLLFPAVSLIMLIMLFVNSQNYNDLSISTFVFSCILAVANIAILYLIRVMEKHTKEEYQLALLNQQMEIQTTSIMALEKSYRSQRKASHEFMHQMQTISDLLANGEQAEAQAYIEHIQGLQTTRIFAIDTHHPILNAILNQKYQLACEQDTEMLFQINDLSSITIETNALVVLFSNLLDNALEACYRLPGDRKIQCNIVSGENLYISIRNTTPPVTITDGKIETVKEPKEAHGYGLRNACQILDGLRAEYVFDYKEGWFQFAAEIPLSINE